LNKACASVLIAINSTHSNQVSIILLTAFCQPHHTQTTLILATGEIDNQILISSGHLLPFGLLESKSLNLSSLLIIIL
jgi:hypothetical protein